MTIRHCLSSPVSLSSFMRYHSLPCSLHPALPVAIDGKLALASGTWYLLFFLPNGPTAGGFPLLSLLLFPPPFLLPLLSPFSSTSSSLLLRVIHFFWGATHTLKGPNFKYAGNFPCVYPHENNQSDQDIKPSQAPRSLSCAPASRHLTPSPEVKKYSELYHHRAFVPVFEFHKTQSDDVYIFVSGFFCSAGRLWDLSLVFADSSSLLFLLCSIALCGHARISLSVPLLKDIWF